MAKKQENKMTTMKKLKYFYPLLTEFEIIKLNIYGEG